MSGSIDSAPTIVQFNRVSTNCDRDNSSHPDTATCTSINISRASILGYYNTQSIGWHMQSNAIPEERDANKESEPLHNKCTIVINNAMDGIVEGKY